LQELAVLLSRALFEGEPLQPLLHQIFGEIRAIRRTQQRNTSASLASFLLSRAETDTILVDRAGFAIFFASEDVFAGVRQK
jgi:hypothetical protein